MFEIEYFSQGNDNCPVIEFLRSQTPKDRAKILREIDLLAQFGLALGLPHIKKIAGTKELWELRVKRATNDFRVFYFCMTAGKMVLLHAIRKATKKTPPGDIDTALKRLKEYKERR